jgi:hypothetical protein
MNWFAAFWFGHQGSIYLVLFVISCLSYSAFPHRRRALVIVFWFVVVMGLVIFGFLAFDPSRAGVLSEEQLAGVLIGYSAALYAALCDLLRFGLAHFVTEKLGPKWVKEMDYPYLLLGAVGLLVSMAKLEVLRDHSAKLDVVGPILVATAIVIRLIKTRADVGDWNKL